MRNRSQRKTQSGFTLIETMIALIVMVVGMLSLAMVIGSGVAYMNTSQADYIAQQKAAEAVESIFTARDIGQTTWSSICNVGSSVCCAGIASCTPAGVFVTNNQPLCGSGVDGIIGTADDYNGSSCAGCAAYACPDAILVPNSTGTFGTGTPVYLQLSNYKRQIAISNVTSGGSTLSNVRQITITISYSAGAMKNRTYTLNAYISNFS